MKSFSLSIMAGLVIAGLSSASAFQVASPIHPPTRGFDVMQPLNTAAELSPVDEMCIENVAEFCLHESCDVEEYEALINQLEDQKAHFIAHVAKVEELLRHLKNSNHPEHDPAEVDDLIVQIKETLASSPTKAP